MSTIMSILYFFIKILSSLFYTSKRTRFTSKRDRALPAHEVFEIFNKSELVILLTIYYYNTVIRMVYARSI